MNSTYKLGITFGLIVAVCCLGVRSAYAAKKGIAGFWHCEMTYGTLVKKYNVRFKQKDTTLNSEGYNEEVLTPYMFGTGTIVDNQISLSEGGEHIYEHDWTATFDGKTITGTVITKNVFNLVGEATLSCRLAPEKDLGTSWKCEGPQIFYKNKAITRKNANTLIQKQINELGSAKKNKVKKTALKTLKRVINKCGGA